MIGFEVYLNGKKLAVAGAEDLGVLSVIVGAGGRLGRETTYTKGWKRKRAHINLSVGGLTSRPDPMEDQHLDWVKLRPLRVGDKVSVRIIRTTRPSKYQSALSVRDLRKKRALLGGREEKTPEKEA